MNPIKSTLPRRCPSGFTLVELLVTILIITVIAAIAFLGSRRAAESAHIANNVTNLRNLGIMAAIVADDYGSYPPGWSFAKGESWADLVIRQMHGESIHQDAMLLSPLVAKNIPPNFQQTAISNYAVNPFIFVSEGVNGHRGYLVTPARLYRPSEQILLGDALPRSADAPYGFSMIVWWALRTGTGNAGNPPVSPQSRANHRIQLPTNIAEMEHDGGALTPADINGLDTNTTQYSDGNITLTPLRGGTPVTFNGQSTPNATAPIRRLGTDPAGIGNINAFGDPDLIAGNANDETLRLAFQPTVGLTGLTWDFARARGTLETDGIRITGFLSDPMATLFGPGTSGLSYNSATGTLRFVIDNAGFVNGFNADGTFNNEAMGRLRLNGAASAGQTLNILVNDSVATGAQLPITSISYIPEPSAALLGGLGLLALLHRRR